MSLFGPDRPKGITEEELYFVRGELRNAPMGHSAEILTEYQVEELIDRLKLCLDEDGGTAIAHKWKQVDTNEVTEVENQLDTDKKFRLSSAQRDHVHKVLSKYLDINKVRSFF